MNRYKTIFLHILALLKSDFSFKKKLFCLFFVKDWLVLSLPEYFQNSEKHPTYGLYRNCRVRNPLIAKYFLEFLPLDSHYTLELMTHWTVKELSKFLINKPNAKLFHKIIIKFKEDKRYHARYPSFFALCLILKDFSYDLIIKKSNILLTPLDMPNVSNGYYYKEIEDVQNLLNQYHEKRVDKLIGSDLNGMGISLLNYLFDAAAIYSREKIKLPKKPKSSKFLSQYLIKHHQLKIKKPIFYDYEDLHLTINNQNFKNYVIKLPESSHELIKWSLDLENCLNNYEERVLQKNNKNKDATIFIGLFENDVLNFVAEIKHNSVHELKGIRNTNHFKYELELSSFISKALQR